MSLLSRLLELIGRREASASRPELEAQVMLLSALAHADGLLHGAEREALASAAARALGDPERARELLAEAQDQDIDELAATLRRGLSAQARGQLIAAAEALAGADGAVGEIEDATLDRFARLLGVARAGGAA